MLRNSRIEAFHKTQRFAIVLTEHSSISGRIYIAEWWLKVRRPLQAWQEDLTALVIMIITVSTLQWKMFPTVALTENPSISLSLTSVNQESEVNLIGHKKHSSRHLRSCKVDLPHSKAARKLLNKEILYQMSTPWLIRTLVDTFSRRQKTSTAILQPKSLALNLIMNASTTHIMS